MTNDPLMTSPGNGVAKRKFGLLRVVRILVVFRRSASLVITNVGLSDQLYRGVIAIPNVDAPVSRVYIYKAAFQEGLYLRIK